MDIGNTQYQKVNGGKQEVGPEKGGNLHAYTVKGSFWYFRFPWCSTCFGECLRVANVDAHATHRRGRQTQRL